MLIENAFHYLPEILCGSNYAAQDYEAGIVNAVSLAVLQELNARNVPNPLAALTVEKLYSKDGFDRPDDNTSKKRHLRSDLFVDTSRTFVGSEGLSRFGWRHKNYLEAKFFRPGGASSTNNAALLIGDVIRLCCLVPPTVVGWEKKSKKPKPSPCDGDPAKDGKYRDICVGRYLLHVYEGSVQALMGKKARSWAKELRSANSKPIEVRIGDDKSITFKSAISTDLADLTIKIGFTNRVISQQEAAGKTHYLCVLTRIDSFTASIGDLTWTENENREGEESKPGDWRRLQAKIGKYLLFTSNAKKKGEDIPPSEDELEGYDEDAESDGGEQPPVDQVAGVTAVAAPTVDVPEVAR